MSADRLSPVQRAVLASLAHLKPRWTLVGGAALAGFHLGHRETRDLNLFWSELAALDDLPEHVTAALRSSGFVVERRETSPAFVRLVATSSEASTVVDLVADPATALEQPLEQQTESGAILVATPYSILVDKLCALLGRSEPRDLFDVRGLVESGMDLERAVRDAPRRDGGFSPMTLAWVLHSAPAGPLRSWPGDLVAWRDEFVEELTRLAGSE